MNEKEKALLEKIKKMDDKLEQMEKEQIELQKKGGEPVKETSLSLKEQLKTIGGSKPTIEDFIGKSLVISKDAKMGTMETYNNQVTEGMVNDSAWDNLIDVFGIETVAENMVNHTFLGVEDMELTVDDVVVAECAIAEDNVFETGQEKFAVSKHALKGGVSIEFSAFMNGGLEALEKSLVTNLNNLSAKLAINADKPNYIGLLSQTQGRKFGKTDLLTPGTFTAAEIVNLKDKSKLNIGLTGYYIMPKSARVAVESLEDNNGNLIFRSYYTNQVSFMNFTQVGVIAGRPVIEVPDYVWFKTGEDMTTAGKSLVAFVEPSAFGLYKSSVEKYAGLTPDIVKSDLASKYDVVIDIKRGTGAGCLELTPMALRGFGIKNQYAGALLGNATARRK